MSATRLEGFISEFRRFGRTFPEPAMKSPEGSEASSGSRRRMSSAMWCRRAWRLST